MLVSFQDEKHHVVKPITVRQQVIPRATIFMACRTYLNIFEECGAGSDLTKERFRHLLPGQELSLGVDPLEQLVDDGSVDLAFEVSGKETLS